MDADSTTGMLVGQTENVGGRIRFNQTRIGGTSLATPLMAGMVAMADQHARGRIGDLTPIVYRLKRQRAGAFTDVTNVHAKDGNVFRLFNNGLNPRGGTTYVLAAFGHDTTLTTRRGWDDTTGVGAPDARFLTAFAK
jgi:subtilase family serine protease